MHRLSRMAGALAVAWLAASLAPAVPVAAAAALGAPNVWKFYIVQSPSTGKIERFWVGHPAALKAGDKYPVIYFLPGLLDGDDTRGTFASGKQFQSFSTSVNLSPLHRRFDY